MALLGVAYIASGVAPSNWRALERDIEEAVSRASAFALPFAQKRYLAHSVFICGRVWIVVSAAVPLIHFLTRTGSLLFVALATRALSASPAMSLPSHVNKVGAASPVWVSLSTSWP